jgi:hypothetical protein
MQCGSIRDCTEPTSHPLTLGGQQWRRREKRKLRRRRRLQSVGRRSSRRDIGLRHRMCRRSRHTGRPKSRADQKSPEAGRLRWTTGASARRRCKFHVRKTARRENRETKTFASHLASGQQLALSHLAEALGNLTLLLNFNGVVAVPRRPFLLL